MAARKVTSMAVFALLFVVAVAMTPVPDSAALARSLSAGSAVDCPAPASYAVGAEPTPVATPLPGNTGASGGDRAGWESARSPRLTDSVGILRLRRYNHGVVQHPCCFAAGSHPSSTRSLAGDCFSLAHQYDGPDGDRHVRTGSGSCWSTDVRCGYRTYRLRPCVTQVRGRLQAPDRPAARMPQ